MLNQLLKYFTSLVDFMIMQQFFIFIILISTISLSYSDPMRNIAIGYSDTLDVTKEAANMICLGFEAEHPNNHCTSNFTDAEVMWNALMNNEIQAALMSEETLIANQKQRKQPIIITPLYQQYLILIGNHDLALDTIQSFHDRTIGVMDWETKEYRGKPLSLALGLQEQDIYFPISKTHAQLSQLFCDFSIDGVMIMSDPSDALARELTTSCNGEILSFTNQQIQKIIQRSIGLYPGIIPKGTYWRVNEDINTLRSRVFLVINPDPNVVLAVTESLDHIKEEIDLVTLRTNITAASILETYDINPIPLHSSGQTLINDLRHDQANQLLTQSPDESLNEN